jgi:glycosyltransferase involved in cell wall biosynthesis
MAKILYVSKPVEPPFRDGSKNLARSLATRLTRHDAQVLVSKGTTAAPAPLGPRRLEALPVYRAHGVGYAPRVADHLPVLRHLAFERDADLHHYFFAPNPRTASAGRVLRSLRGKMAVHTVASAPREDVRLGRALFADVHVVLSKHTEARFLAAGISADRVRRIPAFIEPLVPSGLDRSETRRGLGLPVIGPLVTFPGDLEHGGGAEVLLRALQLLRREELFLAIAHRPKTAHAERLEADLRAQAAALGVTERVRFVGETPQIHALLEASDVIALPSASLYGKTDQPLVLLEAMSLGRPVVVAEGSAAEELAEGGGALAVTPAAEALADALRRLLSDAGARETLGVRARRAVAERFSVEAGVAAYEALYDELLGTTSGG